MRPLAPFVVVAFHFVAGAACGGTTTDPGPPPVPYQGALPATVSARFLSNVLTVNASVNGTAPRPLVVDTGAALTGVDPLSYPDAKLDGNASTLASLSVGALTFANVPSTALAECGSKCGIFDITGALGGNVLRSFAVGFDYAAPAVIFGDAPPPATVATAPVTIPFQLAGGGMGTIAGGSGPVVDIPATRVVVSVSIEGTARTMIVDTGASYTLLRQSLFATLVADGRAQLTLESSTAQGTAQGSIARTHALSVGAATSAGSPVASVPDDFLQNLTNEVGSPIDGLLGGAFLRAYYTLVDYPHTQLALYPYSAPDKLADELVRAGVFLASSGAGYVIAQTLAGAPPNLQGATLIDVDGTKVNGLDPEAADRLLRGAAGSSHVLHVQHKGASSVEAVTLPVTDVLPL